MSKRSMKKKDLEDAADFAAKHGLFIEHEIRARIQPFVLCHQCKSLNLHIFNELIEDEFNGICLKLECENKHIFFISINDVSTRKYLSK